MKEQDLIDLGFKKIIADPNDWEGLEWHYYIYEFNNGFSLISNDSDNLRGGEWYVEFYDYDTIEIPSKKDVQTLIEIIEKNNTKNKQRELLKNIMKADEKDGIYNDPIDILYIRLKKIGINIELIGNAPCIYLHKVNGNVVRKEDFNGEHGFTIGYFSGNFSKIKDIFRIIRKYR